MIVYIYGLRDPATEEIRYIGKANNPKARLSNHLACNDVNRHKNHWIASLKKIGLKPDLIILEETNTLEWEEREKHWIKYGRDNGWRLTNICEGGSNNLYPVHRIIDRAVLLPFVEENNIEKLYSLSQEEIDALAIETLTMSSGLMRGYYTGKTDGREAYKASRKYVNMCLSL